MAGFFGRGGIEYQDGVSDTLAKMPEAIRAAAIEAVMAYGEIVRARAYELANVSKGRGHGANGEHMRDEIKVTLNERPQSISVKIGVDMSVIPYAAHQEFGARGKPFLRPAIDETRQEGHEAMRVAMADGMSNLKTLVRFRRFA